MRTREQTAEVNRRKKEIRKARLLSLIAGGLSIPAAADALGEARSTADRWVQVANSNRIATASAELTRRGAELLPLIVAMHQEYPDAGAPTMRTLLEQQVGERASKNTIAYVMRHVGIQGALYEKRASTPMDYAPNLLKRDFRTRDINQVWVADTTQIRVARGKWLYVAAVLDLHNRELIGYAIGPVNDSRLTGAALRMAFRDRNPAPGTCIYHTDRGAPYCSEAHKDLIAALGLQRSNSALGKCHDNAVMESTFSLLKRILRVWLEGRRTTTFSYRAMRAKILKLVAYYNSHRLHGTLGGYTPVAFAALPLETRRAIHARHDALRERRKARRMAEITARKRAATCGVLWLCLSLGMVPANDSSPGAIGRAA